MNQATAIDSREFRTALGAFATGVTIVTAVASDRTPVGVTANSFNSVSLNPPMILWSLAKNSRSLPVFQAAGHWAVHILAVHQEDLADRFSRSGGDKFAGLQIESGIGGAPLLPNCASRLQCRTAFRYDGGDHVIFVGEVVAFDRNDLPPLVFHGGQYAFAARKTDPALLAGATAGEQLGASHGEDALGYLLWRAYLQFRDRLNVPLSAHQLNAESFQILAMLLHDNGDSESQLAANLPQVTAATLQLELAQFRARGWIEVAGSGSSALYRLSASGREVTLRIHASSKAIEAELLARLEPGEDQLLRDLLRRFGA